MARKNIAKKRTRGWGRGRHPRPIPQEDVAEKKELVKRKGVIPQRREPDWEENEQRESPVEPEMRMMPEIPEMEEFDIQEYEKKKTKDRRKRIKKNPRKNWKELGLLEKRGLA